jgi:hypothetical protein
VVGQKYQAVMAVTGECLSVSQVPEKVGVCRGSELGSHTCPYRDFSFSGPLFVNCVQAICSVAAPR